MNDAPTPLSSTARFLLDDLIARETNPFSDLHSTAFFYSSTGATESHVTAGDPYSCLQAIALIAIPKHMDGIAIANAGWAAPCSDIPPHRSPDRRRIVFLMLVTRSLKRGTAVIAEGESDFLTDAGAGEGPIADAIESAMLHALMNRP